MQIGLRDVVLLAAFKLSVLYHQSDLFPIEDDFRPSCVPLYYKIDIREIKCKVSITIHS